MENVYISGASRGVGKGIAKILASNGYNLAMCCVNNIESLRVYASSLEAKFGVKARAYKLDVSSEAEWRYVAPTILEDFGSIDVVINNAGISYIGLITDMTTEDWDRIISTNLSSIFYSTKMFLPPMVNKKSGHIINISSMWGEKGASCEVAYSATKGGINSFTKALAKEVAPSNIQVNAISLGVIDTDMNSRFSEDDIRDIVSDIPMNRLGTPREVGEVVLSILSSPTYLTGQVIGMDGGM